MPKHARRSRLQLPFVFAALGATALGAPAAAQAQDPHVDFVASRLDLTQTALAGCVVNVHEHRPPTPPVVEVSIQGTQVALETITPDTSPAWRTCIEGALASALTISRGQAGQLPRRPGIMTVTVNLGVPAEPERRGRPQYAAGQRVRILWGTSWYEGQIVAVQGRNQFLVHYDGWSNSYDEVVGPDRLAQVDPGAGPVTITPATFSIQPGQAVRPGRPGPTPQPLPQPQPLPPPAQVPGNLLVNGGFEQGALPSGGWNVFSTIPGWRTVSGPGVEVQAGAAGSPAEGRQLVELDSHAPSSIAQDVATNPRQLYEIRLSFAARAGTARHTNRLAIVWDGQVVARLDADGMGSDQPRWVTVSYFVRASGRRATLELRDEGTADSLGTYIDDVSVAPVQ